MSDIIANSMGKANSMLAFFYPKSAFARYKIWKREKQIPKQLISIFLI